MTPSLSLPLPAPRRPRAPNYTIYPLGNGGAGVGDVMPYYDAASNTSYIYYLRDIWNDGTNQHHPVNAFTTSDFVSYAQTAAGEVLSSNSTTKLSHCKVEKIGHLSYLKPPDNALKKTKFTEAQIVFALRQADTGVTVAEVCRKMGISEATYYN
jgi:hypothetical protein